MSEDISLALDEFTQVISQMARDQRVNMSELDDAMKRRDHLLNKSVQHNSKVYWVVICGIAVLVVVLLYFIVAMHSTLSEMSARITETQQHNSPVQTATTQVANNTPSGEVNEVPTSPPQQPTSEQDTPVTQGTQTTPARLQAISQPITANVSTPQQVNTAQQQTISPKEAQMEIVITNMLRELASIKAELARLREDQPATTSSEDETPPAATAPTSNPYPSPYGYPYNYYQQPSRE